jgi:DNA-binding CsgD family transcriptional regulator/pimeloyl-ACP methyl ester carboxylesterase
MADGSRVAFHVLGTGPAVAMLFPYHVNHLTLNWRVPLHRGAIRFLARHFTVINLDFPGAGLSRPHNGRLSVLSFSNALEAVRRRVGVERLALCAMGAAGLIACHFSARHQERVTRLVLIASGDSAANRQLLHLRQASPEVEAELRGALLGGVGDKRNARALADVARASLTAPTLAAWERLLQRESLPRIAGEVPAPVLYLHAASDHLVPHAAAQALVDRLRDATLRVVSATSGMDVWRNRAAVREIARFLLAAPGPDPAQRRSPRRSPRAAYPAGLSEREAEVIRLLAMGRTSRQIADDLFISLNTVSYHLRNIFAKTGASNRTEAAAFAFAAGIASRG